MFYISDNFILSVVCTLPDEIQLNLPVSKSHFIICVSIFVCQKWNTNLRLHCITTAWANLVHPTWHTSEIIQYTIILVFFFIPTICEPLIHVNIIHSMRATSSTHEVCHSIPPQKYLACMQMQTSQRIRKLRNFCLTIFCLHR